VRVSGDLLVLPLRMVWRRSLRSALAALGIAIVIGAMLMAVAIAEKGKRAALGEIQRMGANVLTVSAESQRNRGGRARGAAVVTSLTLVDARIIEREISHVGLVVGEYRAVIPVKVGDLARQAVVSGIEPAYGTLREAPIRAGRFFDDGDDAQRQRVAVLGARIAADLFGSVEPVGSTIRLRGVLFNIIGVFAERGTGLDAFDEDEAIFVPLKTARQRLFPAEYVHRLFVRVLEGGDLADVGAAIVGTLKARHHTTGQDPLDFRVQDQHRLVTLRETTVRRLGAFEAEVTSALLLAGAMGIFALQLLSVRERRGEIGTRRAIGATRTMIFAQFLIEASAICVTGSLVGAALGACSAAVAGATIEARLAIAAGGVSIASGVFASVFPALAAASLHPAVALRAQ
jgi:putative ABC transport system permease protein